MGRKSKMKIKLEKLIERLKYQVEDLESLSERLDKVDYIDFNFKYRIGHTGRGTFGGGFEVKEDQRK